jgi:hypothetical protein
LLQEGNCLFSGLLIYCIGQQSNSAGTFNGFRQLALMLGTSAQHASRRDLAALVDVTAQAVNIFIVDKLDFIGTEIAYLFTGPTASARAHLSFASILRHVHPPSMALLSDNQKGSSSSSTLTKPLFVPPVDWDELCSAW